jgi:hypothetical protein
LILLEGIRGVVRRKSESDTLRKKEALWRLGRDSGKSLARFGVRRNSGFLICAARLAASGPLATTSGRRRSSRPLTVTHLGMIFRRAAAFGR